MHSLIALFVFSIAVLLITRTSQLHSVHSIALNALQFIAFNVHRWRVLPLSSTLSTNLIIKRPHQKRFFFMHDLWKQHAKTQVVTQIVAFLRFIFLIILSSYSHVHFQAFIFSHFSLFRLLPSYLPLCRNLMPTFILTSSAPYLRLYQPFLCHFISHSYSFPPSHALLQSFSTLLGTSLLLLFAYSKCRFVSFSFSFRCLSVWPTPFRFN